jgi:hypothetical protein
MSPGTQAVKKRPPTAHSTTTIPGLTPMLHKKDGESFEKGYKA